MDIEILNPERLRYWCGRIDMPAAAVDVLVEVAQTIVDDPAMLQFFSAFHEKTVLGGEWHREWSELSFDPAVQAHYGARVSLFYLLAYLSALPIAAREYRRRGIDDSIFDNTLREISTWFCHEYDLRGAWEFRQFSWIWRSLSCVLFRLGRLQFMPATFSGGVRAFRRLKDGEILLLADPELALRTDGCAWGAGQARDDAPASQPDETVWRPLYEESQAGWKGHPVSPYGRAEKTPVWLARAEWQLILQAGDDVLDLHIPRSDPFSVADCRDSLRQAETFFAGQYPEQTFKAYFCHTWFFTPQLQQLLPAESNIVRFQREFHLYPFAGGPGFLWSFAFGERYPDVASAPRDTSLRRAVLDWLAGGGELFDLPGVRFHGAQEWGSQPYMRAWDQGHPGA